MSKRISLLISFLLCMAISTFIVIHSYEYLKHLLNPTIALLTALVIEISYICYSIMGAILGRWTKTDLVIKILLFFLSVVPATMQTSQDARRVFLEKVTLSEPVKPVDISDISNGLQTQLDRIDEEVAALRSFKNTYNLQKNDRTWYAYQDQKRIDNLMASRNQILEEKNQLESDYLAKSETYNLKQAAYTQEKDKFSFDIYFNLLFIAWTVLIVWILQMVNGRLSGAISVFIAERGSANVFESGLDRVRPEIVRIVQQLKPVNRNETEIRKIFADLQVFEYSDLKTFLETDYAPAIKQKYPTKKAREITDMLNTVKNALVKSESTAEMPPQGSEADKITAKQTLSAGNKPASKLPKGIVPA